MMDFGVLSRNSNPASPDADPGHGSGNLKRSGLVDDTWRISNNINPKMARTSDGDQSVERSNLWGFDAGQKMLSFSSAANSGGVNASRSIAFSGGGYNEVIRGPFARLKGPFTPSQWMELEVQALIYKHFVANVPVPSNLLLPLKRSLYSYGSSGSYASNFLGWGPFHLGFSGSNDPEPGRCRRTDGKKWRCSRDAVPDQKYCERHINRGRHRSRKPVEGQTGHAISGSTKNTTANTTTTTTNVVEPIAPPSSASVISGRSASSSLGALQHQLSVLQPNTSNAFSDNLASRTQGFQGHTFTPSNDLKSDDIPFAIPKPRVPLEESSHSMFGLVTSDALVNPSERISYMNSRNADTFMGFSDKETTNQQPVRHFIDDWPKDQPDRSSTQWPEELKSDWTQLSMSIPVAPDFSSSPGSPAQEKSTVSALRLSHEIDPIHMSLGVNQSWLPVSWGNSMGGPLGEVLTTSAGAGQSLNAPKSWNGSPQLGSSPTGVLQKSTFVTLSNNSSSGSSPTRDENKKVHETAATLCSGLGPSLVSSTAIPTL